MAKLHRFLVTIPQSFARDSVKDLQHSIADLVKSHVHHRAKVRPLAQTEVIMPRDPVVVRIPATEKEPVLQQFQDKRRDK